MARRRRNTYRRVVRRLRLGTRLTWCVIVLQGAMLLTLAVTDTWHPPRIGLLELLWAWMHRPTFYPLVALLVGGPVLTIIAWRMRGRHHLPLLLSWLIFGVAAWYFFERRIDLMLRVLWHELRK